MHVCHRTVKHVWVITRLQHTDLYEARGRSVPMCICHMEGNTVAGIASHGYLEKFRGETIEPGG